MKKMIGLLFFPLILFACSFDSIFQFHPAYHWISDASSYGDTLEIEDGSIWDVAIPDMYKLRNWSIDDPIMIEQNDAWFSRYMYKITNQTIGDSVQSNLGYGPVINGEYTKYIAGMNYYYGEVILTNLSRWEICKNDVQTFSTWTESDAIIIGRNSGWFQEYESILINVNMNNFVRAKQR